MQQLVKLQAILVRLAVRALGLLSAQLTVSLALAAAIPVPLQAPYRATPVPAAVLPTATPAQAALRRVLAAPTEDWGERPTPPAWHLKPTAS